MNPTTTVDPAELERIYARRFDAQASYRSEVWRALIDCFVGRYIAPQARVLDLGCGYGQFINMVDASQKYAMDLNPRATQLLHPEVTFLQQDCSQPWRLTPNSLDVVFTSNFLEHLPTKAALSDTLCQAHRCLRNGGTFIAMGPNIKFTQGAYWDFFDHHLPLTELSLKEILEVTGFEIKTVIDRFLPYTMVNAPRYPIAFLRAYLKLPILWPLFGKQFFLIAAKN